MSFIETLRPAEATGAVREMYRQQQDHYGYVPNYAKVFSHRPDLMKLWSDLLRGIRRNMDERHFELVTVAAATAVRSTYCSLAHGKALTEFYSGDEVISIVADDDSSPLTKAERAMFLFARKVARDAARVTAGDVECLKNARSRSEESADGRPPARLHRARDARVISWTSDSVRPPETVRSGSCYASITLSRQLPASDRKDGSLPSS
jgi:uncharacterized peroxidase-related enzyme